MTRKRCPERSYRGNRVCILDEGHTGVHTTADNRRFGLRQGRAPRGEAHPRAVLTEWDVREIRAMVAEGKMTLTAIAREFGVSQSHVSNIVARRTWAHLK